MKISARLTLVIGIFAFSLDGLTAQDEDIADVVASGTNSVPLKRDFLSYPQKAMDKGVEGWAALNFVVKADGTTDEIEVVGVSVENYFEEAAIGAVSGWVYQPATLDGKAVMEGNKSAQVIFSLSNQIDTVTKKFLSRFNRANTAIKENDLATARALIDELKITEFKLLSEVFYLDLIESLYWQSAKDNQKQLAYVERAMVLADVVASGEIIMNLLRQAVVTNAVAGKYKAALIYYKTLMETEEIASDDPLHGIFTQIKQILEGESEIVTPAEISRCELCSLTVSEWRHTLNRNRFFIEKVEGELNEIEVHCGINSVSLIYEPEVVWSVNQGWGECVVKVYGVDGTVFQFIELPFSRENQQQPTLNLSNIHVPESVTEVVYVGKFAALNGAEDGEIIPIVVIRPVYPREAAQRRKEGWVKIEFTITTKGTVKDPRVVESKPRGIFDDEAIKAIKKWKFKPRVVDGIAVERPASQVIDFSLSARRR